MLGGVAESRQISGVGLRSEVIPSFLGVELVVRNPPSSDSASTSPSQIQSMLFFLLIMPTNVEHVIITM